MSIFIDTGVFVGYVNEKDKNHDVACSKFVRGNHEE